MIERFVFCVIAIVLVVWENDAFAQQEELPVDSNAVVTNSLWDNWYAQVGVDMWLQNPYGTNFKNVFPNGKSYGVDVAVGKWFTPGFGMRAKLTLENTFLQSDHAKWIHHQKGYFTVVEDFQFDILNLFGDYKPDRKYTLIVFPRAGAFVELKNGVGSPILGLGIGNVFRLNDKWSLYADVSYQATNSVIGSATDTGSGSNGYFDISVGVQMNLGKQGFHKVSDKVEHSKDAVILNNSLWDNWFIQAGLGMSLLNRYGENFAHVFPNGKTFGINLGMGKWITPGVGIRGGLNWQNGIVGNSYYSWMDTKGQPGSNHDGGGWVAAYADLFLNLHNLFGAYDRDRVWEAIVFPRAGLNSNFEYSTASPIAGIGTEQTFKLNDRLKLFADVAYQFTPNEFVQGEVVSHHSGSTGWFDINVGVQYDLGLNTWYKPGEERINDSRLTVQSSHNWPRFAVNTLASVGVAYIGKSTLKAMIKEERPDHSDNKSFPSGHAAMAFAAARSIDKKFRKNCIWIPIAGYVAATAVGIERVANKHHHWYDVVAGAAVGVGSAELTWWLSDKMFGKGSNIAVGSSGNTVDVAVRW